MTWRNFTQHVRNLTYQDILQLDLSSLINIITTQQTTNSHSWTLVQKMNIHLWTTKSPQCLHIWSVQPRFHIQDLKGHAHYQHHDPQKLKTRTEIAENPPQDNGRQHIKHLHTPNQENTIVTHTPHANLTTDKRNTHFRTTTMQQIPPQFLHLKTSWTTTTATTQSTTETKCWSRTVHSTSTIKLVSVSDNSYRPFHEPSSNSCSTSNTVHTTDMEYMHILGMKDLSRTNADEDKHFFFTLKTLTFAKQEL